MQMGSKKAGVAILISDKIYLKIKKITRDKEGHYIMIKGSIQDKDITIVNIYIPKKYKRRKKIYKINPKQLRKWQ